MVADALDRLFLRTYELLASQEISGSGNSEVLRNLLPGGTTVWSASFADTTDRQDNGFWIRPTVRIGDVRTLFATSMLDGSGRIVADPTRSVHPPRAAHFTVGNFDFTLITVHLTFAGGDTSESAREMRVLLDYLDDYFEQPGHDPDVIIAGDFNIPSRLSGQTGSGGITLDSIFDQDPRFQVGERRFVVTVHDPTSRRSIANGGVPANNYDHFVLSADTLEEFVQARRVSTDILTAHPEYPEERLTSDHFPVAGFFRTAGAGIQPDASQDAISISSVLNGGSFEPGFAAGSWISIFGENLAPTARTWRPDEIVDGILPTQLDGVQVLINGQTAAVFFISPGQLNVQAPDDDAVGPVLVEVIRDGIGTARETVDLREAAPAFFMFDAEGRKFIAAVHADGVFVGKPDLFGGALAARPAGPGDVILLFGTGFGLTDPPVEAGRVFSGAAPLRANVTIRLGEIEADVLFAGLSGAGLNQFNVVVPSLLQGGDTEVVAETLGQRTQANAFLTVEEILNPPPQPPTVTLTAEPSSIEAGQSTTLQWTSQDATSASIAPGIGAVPVNGMRVVSPTQSTLYTISVTGVGGDASASFMVSVTAPPPPPPTVMFAADDNSIELGQSTTLRWTSQNATSASIEPGIGDVPTNGLRVVSPSQSTLYMITVRGDGGEASASVQVSVTIPPPPPAGILVISQVYGGGGNSGATHRNDFVELFNRGASPAAISGWTVQYASASGSGWSATGLSGVILPGQYYLIQEGTGQSGDGVQLPTPDTAGGIGLSAASGKVALVSGSSLLSGSAPSSPEIVDFVGYGSANFAEGAAAARLSNTTAITRAGGGCIDTDDNGSDFTRGAPSPRNTASPHSPCN